MKRNGIDFITSCEVGKNIKLNKIEKENDAVIITIGAQKPRDINIEGRELKGVYFAMEYLQEQNKLNSGEIDKLTINAHGKNVLVIGGGDTGSDCLGTAIRQKAKKVTQIDIVPKPPVDRTESNPWPEYPQTLKTSSSQNEGGERLWNVLTNKFIGKDKLEAVEMSEVKWVNKDGKQTFEIIEGSNKTEKYDLVFIAAGFVSPIVDGFVAKNNIETTERDNIKAEFGDYKTSREKVFVAGDARRGQSLVVWALAEGRDTAIEVDKLLNTL